ncbi:MAG: hypothetical protein C4527_19005 [Candidatus Omnitrophota bacterium]|nr:MAG: hypothetical protein C4527_19005 [Candidatus Omnitrophota bacterium]
MELQLAALRHRGDIMTAATFSPGDERLHIATDQNRIYGFESRLPAVGLGKWGLYDSWKY